ncbi:MAG: hypothetical protein J6R18_01155 [Kiritimatiellae bacterium]|nr:hypothetical protein [Kiritimatiellia bacterium]
MKKSIVAVVLVSLGALAWFCQRSAENKTSSQADIVIAGLGGFRGILSEIVWFRADRLQNEGNYSEMAQLANLLTALEPHTPEVWSYAAWNLAYNISVMMPTEADRWRWVESALKLLRDDGLRLNPRSPELHKELAWLFLSKIGGNTDSASSLYAARWAQCVEDAKGDWPKLKMNPSLMAYIDNTYGMQDWKDPRSSALYWAHYGLSLKPTGALRAELRQVHYQSLMMMSLQKPQFAPKALKAMREAYTEMPSQFLKELIGRYRSKFAL